jgi:hypothetical protein
MSRTEWTDETDARDAEAMASVAMRALGEVLLDADGDWTTGDPLTLALVMAAGSLLGIRRQLQLIEERLDGLEQQQRRTGPGD